MNAGVLVLSEKLLLIFSSSLFVGCPIPSLIGEIIFLDLGAICLAMFSALANDSPFKTLAGLVLFRVLVFLSTTPKLFVLLPFSPFADIIEVGLVAEGVVFAGGVGLAIVLLVEMVVMVVVVEVVVMVLVVVVEVEVVRMVVVVVVVVVLVRSVRKNGKVGWER